MSAVVISNVAIAITTAINLLTEVQKAQAEGREVTIDQLRQASAGLQAEIDRLQQTISQMPEDKP